ncbi:MAG: hypothetical protein PHT60_14165 [Acidiphilium sp.]|nr:hypothetical protein [Acidiphilium sp.]MDD4936908.1 hypothetical protein [Acidiphilium sp.]
MIWSVTPFVGVDNLKFGMSPSDVETIIGRIDHKIERSEGYVNYYYRGRGQPILGFRDEKLIDITFGRWTEALFFDGLDYFQTPPAIFLDRVRLHDPDLKTALAGDIISFILGMAFDTIDLGESDKAITLFSRSEIEGYWECGPFTPA